MLLGAASVVVLGVLGIAWLTVPDEPSFVEELEEAEAGADDGPFVPDVVGGRVTVSGAREGTIDLVQKGNGPNFGLGSSRTQIYFEEGPLAVSQMDHDGLSFFPDADDCQFTTGEHNEAAGIAAVSMTCPELVDIRGNGTLTVEGQFALPANLVLSLETPETGGTITVGEEQWEIVEPRLFVADRPVVVGETDIGLWLTGDDHFRGIFLEYDPEGDTLRLARLRDDEGLLHEVVSAACTIDDQETMVINPDARLMELTLFCEDVEIAGMEPQLIEGTVLYEKISVTVDG